MRKIWNRPNQQVWSLSTTDIEGKGNMNICTYVSAISMEPKIIMVAVYHDTQTMSNLKTSKRALLQLLSEELAPVLQVCGRLSGAKVDKISRLQKRHQINYLNALPYFATAAGYLELQVDQLISFGGDHDLAICSVLSSKNISDTKLLTTDYLRAEGLLR